MLSQSILHELASCRDRLTQGLETQEAIRLWRSVAHYRKFQNIANLPISQQTKYRRATYVLNQLLRGRCRINSSFQLFRGIHVSDEEIIKKDIFTFDKFIATTPSFLASTTYANGYSSHHDSIGIVFKFLIPANFPVLPISTKLIDADEDEYDLDETRRRHFMTSFSSNIEVLLPNDIRWKVISRQELDDQYVHYVDKGYMIELSPQEG